VDIAYSDGKTPLSLLTKAQKEPDEDDEDEDDEDGDDANPTAQPEEAESA